ncbi:MAG TPA: amidohydrolase family protein, partial [Ramlibacter sp.]|nr:amidohydrolase family protein [Ramlibacter sp.]
EPSMAAGWDAHVHVFEAGAPVRAGHYTPQARTLDEIEALGAAHGIGHLVLVQPSVYGTDNGVLLRALRRTPGRHRGVAVVDGGFTGAQLDELHAAGVRGVRFNLVSPVGNGEDDLQALAPLLRERGWHVQWYAHAPQLPHLLALQQRSGLRFVLDHLAGLTAGVPISEDAWQALAELAAGGAWLKLSGWYRLGSWEPYADIVPLVRRASALFGDRLVWGSDWPHTSLPAAASRHPSLLQPMRQALGDAAAQAVLENHPPRLYGA